VSRLATVLATAALVASAVMGAIADTASVEARASQALTLVNHRTATVRPSKFGANHWGFTKLRWSRWTSSSATASGDASWSYPGGDGSHHSRVTLHFSKVERACGHRTYTAVTFRTRSGATGEGALDRTFCSWIGF
jgi:hypothetical protein